MRYGPGTGGGVAAPKPKPPRPHHVAGLRKADAIDYATRHYAENPRKHAGELRILGVKVADIRKIHADKVGQPKQPQQTQGQTRPHRPSPAAAGASLVGGYAGRQVRVVPKVTPQPVRQQPSLEPLSRQQLTHALVHGWKPPSIGPYATPADAAQARIEAQYHSPQTLGGLGRRTTELATGVDPLHPLRHELFGSGAANLGLGVASFLPIVRGPRALFQGMREARAARSVGRVAEEAGRAAKTVRPIGPLTREQAQATAKKEVSGSLMGARRAAAEQKKVYSAARAEKFAKAQAAGEQAGGGIAGLHAELGQLKGALPRVKFEKLKNGNLNQHDLEGLFNDIKNHPDLKYGETLTARTALAKAFEEGHALAPHEIRILSKAFGEDATQVLASKTFRRKVGENALGALNLPRALMASVDVSFPGRQGLGVLAASPRIWTKGFKPQFRGLVSEEYYQKMLDHLHQDPAFDLADEAGVKFTELGKGAAQREEPFATTFLTNKPVKYNPVRASARAYTMYGDYVRLELFKKYLAKAERQGVNIENKNELRGIAKVVNTLSGRGGGRRLQQAAPVISPLVFAPQLVASRLNMLNPVWYSRLGPLTPFARRQAKIAGARLGVGAAGLLGGAAYAGAKVQTDPRSADFAKVRLGNTRIDVLGGLQQYPRAAAQIASGKAISSTTGRPITLGPGFGNMSRWDVAERFAASKLSPPASAAYDLLKGKTYTGQPLSWQSAIGQRVTPLAIQDAVDLYREKHNLPQALGSYGLSATGVGVQTYGPRDTAKLVRQRNDKLRVALAQSIQQYLGRGLTPQVTKALQLRERREVWFDKVLPPPPGSGASDDEKKTYALHRFNAQVDLLVRSGLAPDRAQARRAKAWAAGQDYHKVNSETSRIGRKYFGGAALEDATRKIREHGGHFYLGDY